MCGFIYKADSDHSLKGKNVFSADECNIGTVVSSLGNILIIKEKLKQEEIEDIEKIRKYEIPLIEIKKVEGPSIILKSKKEHIQKIYLKT
jgi:hypothetical protein